MEEDEEDEREAGFCFLRGGFADDAADEAEEASDSSSSESSSVECSFLGL